MPLLKGLAKLAIGVGVLWWLVRGGGVNPGLMLDAVRQNAALVTLAAGLYLVLVILAGVRWFILLRSAGIPATWGRIFSLHMIGVFFSTILPGGTGGDLAKGFYLFRDTGEKRGLAVSSIVMDRILGVYAMFIMGLLGTLLNLELALGNTVLRMNAIFYSALFGGALLAAVLFFLPMGERLMADPLLGRLPGAKGILVLLAALRIYRAQPLVLLGCLGVTVLIHVSLLVIFYLSACALGADLPFRQHTFAVPILILVNGLPVSPAGLGVGEAAAEFLYGVLGMTQGGETHMMFHAYVILVAALGAPFYFLYERGKKVV